MWKVEYPGGQREINQLHIPVDRDVQLLMTSEDVIHDFGLPDFRMKRDVLPGRYEALWLRADTDRLVSPVLRPVLRHRPCRDGRAASSSCPVRNISNGWSRTAPAMDLVAQGKTLFIRNGCAGCHQAGLSGGGGTVRAPR